MSAVRTRDFFQTVAVCLVMVSLVVLAPALAGPLGNNPVLSFMMWGSFLIYLASRPKMPEWVIAVLLAIGLRLAYGFFIGLNSSFGSWLINWGGFAGLASLLVMFVQAVRSRDSARATRWTTLLVAGALPYSWIVIALCLGSIAQTPRTYDALLLAFDSSLGFAPSSFLAKAIEGRPLLTDLTHTIYNALPLGASCVLAWYLESSFRPVRVIPMYITLMIGGVFLYAIYPAAGPHFAYAAGFPDHLPAKWEILAQPLAPFVAPRNAMPSLHFGAMLLLLWNSRAWRPWARIAALLFTAGIAFSTLALGEHYLIDLIVAFPVMLAVQALWTRAIPLTSPPRYRAAAAGLLATAAWLAALRWSIPTFLAYPLLAWVCVLVTVAGSIYLELTLARAAWSSCGQSYCAPDGAVAFWNSAGAYNGSPTATMVHRRTFSAR